MQRAETAYAGYGPKKRAGQEPPNSTRARRTRPSPLVNQERPIADLCPTL